MTFRIDEFGFDPKTALYPALLCRFLNNKEIPGDLARTLAAQNIDLLVGKQKYRGDFVEQYSTNKRNLL